MANVFVIDALPVVRLEEQREAPDGGAAANVESRTPQRHDTLSPREREVLGMILAGARPKEIAHALDLSVKTISTHRFRIMRKLGVEGDVMLTRYAIRHSLISCE